MLFLDLLFFISQRKKKKGCINFRLKVSVALVFTIFTRKKILEYSVQSHLLLLLNLDS